MKWLNKKKKIKTDIHGRPIMESDQNRKKIKRKQDTVPENKTIANIIAPMKIQFLRNYAIIGDNLSRCFGLTRYPQHTEHGWLRKLTNIHGTVATIHYSPLEKGEAIKIMSANIKNHRSVYGQGRQNPASEIQSDQTVENAEEALKRIIKREEKVGSMSMVIMPLVESDAEFKKISENVKTQAKQISAMARNMSPLQKEGTQFVWPTYVTNTDKNIVHRQTARLMPLEAFFGGFPFAASGLNDKAGYYLGNDSLGGPVTVDFWKRGESRTNSNRLFCGESGQGKSADMKNCILMEYMLGNKIFILDPQGEYKELALNLDGEWINASGANGKVLNPLEVLRLPKDENEGDEDQLTDLQEHMKVLEVFLKLYLEDITFVQLSLLKEAIEEVYRSFGITWDSDLSKLKSTDYPVFKDIYDYLLNKAEASRKNGDEKRFDDYRDLSLILRDISIGSDSFLWGRHSTLKINADVVSIDTSGLNSSPDNVKSAQYFLLQKYIWQRATRSNKERCNIIYDEAHMIINKRVPQAMVTLSEDMRLARKFEASIWVASHQVNDFIDPEIKLHGAVILDIPTYKFLHGMDGNGLRDVSMLFNLKSSEREVLEKKVRGRALFFCGNERYDLRIKIDDYKFKYFGEAGGR
ncbi:VirB4 family type IV secretion system protein [Eubacterium callanderi]|uniref:VirB4 family type IV secretion system protein n=1 Tax=Eubacterium callanderi TaxID=53442 RepID=UPI002673E8B2|nr:ATP-binding protein [Eubacterium callanderi]